MRTLRQQTIVLFIFLWPICTVALTLRGFRESVPDTSPYATCGDCFCIPESPDEKCPSPSPRTNYSEETIAMLSSQIPENPYTLTCDPYQKGHHHFSNCTTTPPQNETLVQLGDQAVCGIQYRIEDTGISPNVRASVFSTPTEGDESTQKVVPRSHNLGTSSCPTHYQMTTYESREHAKLEGAQITHAGACGACSTLQDLSVYIKNPDLTDPATICSTAALINYHDGIYCYLKLGFTEECAKIWVYNGLNTRQACLVPCVRARFEKLDNNGPPPLCALNTCLECDEKESGPVFRKIAGRTRRRSGLLSAIARPCKDVVNYTDHNPCPDGDIKY